MESRLQRDAFESAKTFVDRVEGGTRLLECMSTLYENREALQADMDDGFHHLKMIFEEAEIASATVGTTRKRENETEGEYYVLKGAKKQRLVGGQAGVARVEGSEVVQRKPNKERHKPTDISNGHENVKIPWVNTVNDERPPLDFTYMKENEVYGRATVDRSLSAFPKSCQKCYGDCVGRKIGCGCNVESRGVYAYGRNGLLTRPFLEDLIHRDERAMEFCDGKCRPPINDVLQVCKGHPRRDFIHECGKMCTCSASCSNRVVQRGITRKLEVHYYRDKGWGLRTLEDLPPGAFVSEYAGDILTELEQQDRARIARLTNARHTFPMCLNTCWRNETYQDDNTGLNLDATFRGNAGRFVNHRCEDANLNTVPVMIDSYFKRYHHVAFFTVKDVRAGEELTWDYTIDFNDNDEEKEPAFKCLCGSRYCRDVAQR